MPLNDHLIQAQVIYYYQHSDRHHDVSMLSIMYMSFCHTGICSRSVEITRAQFCWGRQNRFSRYFNISFRCPIFLASSKVVSYYIFQIYCFHNMFLFQHATIQKTVYLSHRVVCQKCMSIAFELYHLQRLAGADTY